MGLKVILRSYKGHKYILCIIDEVTNYFITIPKHKYKSEKIGDALIENVISTYCVPNYIIIDQDSAFMSSLINYLFKKLHIKIKTVAPYNPLSLQAECGIKYLSTILTKHLMNLGQMWPKYLPLVAFIYNTFNTQNLPNYSPYEWVLSRKPKLLLLCNPNDCYRPIHWYSVWALVWMLTQKTNVLHLHILLPPCIFTINGKQEA